MKPEPKPGDLCLFIGQIFTGETCKVLEPASPDEVLAYGFAKTGDFRIALGEKSQLGGLWKIDRNFPWRIKQTGLALILLELPICPGQFLLPIEPDSTIVTEQVRETLQSTPSGIQRISK